MGHTILSKINELDDSKLIEIAMSSDEVIDFGPTNDVIKFIYELQITEGTTKIRPTNIYDRYLQTKTRQQKIVPKKVFFKTFCKEFTRYIDKYSSYYLLDPSPFNMSEEDIELAKKNIVRPPKKKYGEPKKKE